MTLLAKARTNRQQALDAIQGRDSAARDCRRPGALAMFRTSRNA